MDRRVFLKVTGLSGLAYGLTGCGIMNRLRGIPRTDLPVIEGAWTFNEHTLTLDLTKLPELGELGGAVRIEGDVMPNPVLVVKGDDGAYYAYQNACTHGGRKIDPLPGKGTLECCSVSKSKYDYAGNVLSGPAKGPLTVYPVAVEEQRLLISV